MSLMGRSWAATGLLHRKSTFIVSTSPHHTTTKETTMGCRILQARLLHPSKVSTIASLLFLSPISTSPPPPPPPTHHPLKTTPPTGSTAHALHSRRTEKHDKQHIHKRHHQAAGTDTIHEWVGFVGHQRLRVTVRTISIADDIQQKL